MSNVVDPRRITTDDQYRAARAELAELHGADFDLPAGSRVDELIALIENHDDQLALHFSEGRLALDSYKEYIELFARSLKETMESKEGVDYLLRSCGFEISPEDINLTPETRWKK